MNEELKENMCNIGFTCGHTMETPCIYWRPNRFDDLCFYSTVDHECKSSVAKVNAMVLECKRLGFVATDEIQKNVLIEIRDLLKQSLDSGCGLKQVELAVEKIEGFLNGGKVLIQT